MDNTAESATKKQKTEEQEPTTTTQTTTTTATTTQNETPISNNDNETKETKETTEPALSYEEIKQKKEKEALAGASSVLPQEHYAPAEEKVGIECFLGTHTGFSGILKQRYSDFLVNEIDTNGKVVQIDNFVAPFVEQVQSAEGTDEKVFIEMVGEEKTAEFLQYMKTRNSDKTSKFFFKSEEDKMKRTQLHRLIKERFKDVLTETQDNAVVVMPANQARTRRDDVSQWPADKPKYVEFLLFKENRETMNALLVLSQLLKTTTKTFSFAGTKDKRGVTVQRATAFRINPERLSAINPKLFGMKVGNFQFVEKHLRLGDLNGNKFQITIRDINASDDEVKLASESLMKTGFINYYGLQRFGTGQVATNHVGLALLKKDWAGAAHLILDPRQGESVEATEARVFYQKTGDIKTTLDMLPNFLSVERMLLRGLKKSGPTSFLNAFSMIPRTMRMMYAHAYQSYIWNAMASERIRLFGFQEPVVGDLVALDVEAPTANDVEEEVDLDEATESELEVQQNVDEKFKVAIVTEDDVKNKKYTIDQVVLPLPGYEIIYPQHVIAQKMKDMLIKDGLDPDNMKRAQKEYDLRGAYRKIIIKPAEFSWKIMHYDDVAIPLISTDIDKMNNAPEPADVPAGKYKALILSFHLPSSCYATMLFRELLKMPTSKLTQKTLSDEFAHRENRNKNNDNNKKFKGKEVNFNRNRREKDQAKRKRD